MQAVAFFDPNSSCNSGKISGTVYFHQESPTSPYTTVTFNLAGFSRTGNHGCHIHNYGDLTQKCTSTCSHFNPRGSKHSSIRNGDKFGPRHVGDLINNLNVWQNQSDSSLGIGRYIYVGNYRDDLVRLYGPESILGRAVVIHKDADDCGIYQNERDPNGNLTEVAKESGISGNAGERIACAVIGLAMPNKNSCS